MAGRTPRFFVNRPVISCALVVVAIAWGAWGYHVMPRRKDPRIVVPVAAVVCPWPGARAAQIERELTVPLEDSLRADPRVETIESVSRDNVALLRVVLDEHVSRPGSIFDALRRALDAAHLPPGSGPAELLQDTGDTAALLLAVAGAGLAPAELDRVSRAVADRLAAQPEVEAVRRVGVPPRRVYVDLDLGRVQAAGLDPLDLFDTLPAVALPAGPRPPDPATAKIFGGIDEIASSPLGLTRGGAVTLGSVARIGAGPEEPPRERAELRVAENGWRQLPAVVLDVQKRPAASIKDFGRAMDAALAAARAVLPPGIVLERVSDQHEQVEHSLGLFGRSLAEAVVLVVIVALVGFVSVRAAAILALSIPLTLAVTFGLLGALGIDLQQVSTASLILALGLLVDDPVVAGDAIARELQAGRPPLEAGWRGPARLSRVIWYATLTNIVAYLPLLLLTGNIGRFVFSLPVVLTCSLLASRVVSMSFVPLAGSRLLRRAAGGDALNRARARFTGFYRRTGGWALAHRGTVIVVASLLLIPCGWLATALPGQFFPRDVSRLSYVDLWMPAGTRVDQTVETAGSAERLLLDAARRAGAGLRSITTFVGRAAPRFWFSLDPAPPQARYAQLLVSAADDAATEQLLGPAQAAFSVGLPGALADARPLEIGKPVGVPVQVRVSGGDLGALARAAAAVERALAATPGAARVRTDWPALGRSDAARPDPRLEAAVELGGMPVGFVRDGSEFVPVLLRVPPADIERLAAGLARGETSPAGPPEIRRRDGARTVTVSCFPAGGTLSSQVVARARPRLDAIARGLPAGFRLALGGEDEEQARAFHQLAIVLVVSLALIYTALAVQFRSALRPLLVFAALPFGAGGALFALWNAGLPFGFMAFLGIASLAGVIVSHVIVLFDGIEDARRTGAPLETALIDAGLARLRPVVVTVAATVLALVPLAQRGGPLWRPLCYAQIGGLTVATVVTLLIVPVLYASAVRDLRIIRW